MSLFDRIAPLEDLPGIGSIFAALAQAVAQVVNFLVAFVNYTLSAFAFIGQVFRGLMRGVLRGIKALIHLRPSEVWRFVKKIYHCYKALIDFYEKHVLDPIDNVRRNLDRLYQHIFGPIIRTIDSFRHLTSIIAVFNRRLAAKIDSRIFGLEAKILEPLTIAYRRINGLTSVVRAVITRLGLLDRSILIESVRRDAKILLGTITNPRRVLVPKITNPALPDLATQKHDFHEYVNSGTGPMQETEDELLLHFKETLVTLS